MTLPGRVPDEAARGALVDGEQQDRLFADLGAITDHLVSGLDLAELMSRIMTMCTSQLPVAAAGILVDDQQGSLGLLATSSDEARVLELLQLLNGEGPCVEAFTSSREVIAPRLSDAADRWPAFVQGALAREIQSCCALPLELRGRVFGALNLFLETEGRLRPRELQLARLLARLTAVGILDRSVRREQEALASQLRTALQTRVHIEQAKGVIAERAGVSMAKAFDLLRGQARASQRPLIDVAIDITEGRLSPSPPPTRSAEPSSRP